MAGTRVMVMLVGGRQAANALGLLAYQPQVAEFIASRDTPRDLDRILAFARGIPGLKVEAPQCIDAMSVEEAYCHCRRLLSKHAGSELVVNLTTGSKPMGFGARDAAHEADVPAIYIDSRAARIIPVSGSQSQSVPSLTIDAAAYLQVYGRRARAKEPRKNKRIKGGISAGQAWSRCDSINP